MGRHITATASLTLAVLVGLGVSACSNGADDSSATEITAARPSSGGLGELATRDSAEAVDATTAADASGTPDRIGAEVSGRALATTAGVTVSTSDIRRAVDDTLDSVARNNAGVHTADVNIGDEREDGSVEGSGYFVVKVPPADLEPLIADLGATVGTLSGRSQDTSDVTDQLVDLEIRIGVERDVIERFRALLNDATAFQDIVDIERVISERTIALEQLLASQRNLENRVELATLTITLQYVAPSEEPAAPASDGDNTIGAAWRAGWDVFVGILFTVALALAVAAPFLATTALVLGAAWLITRRRTRRTGPAPAAPVTTPAEPVSERDGSLAAPNREP
jgi:hypothetical protein